MAYRVVYSDELCHHGILGQKWGVRRFQNLDGTRIKTPKTVFISGSSKTTDKESGYYRQDLPDKVKSEIDKNIAKGNKIIVGDAPGIDRQVQNYINSKNYKNIEIYGPGKQVRYSANEKWKTIPIDAPEFEEYSKEWLAKKDIVMSKLADFGIAVTLDNGSTATKNNIERMKNMGKNVKEYMLYENSSNDGWRR